MKTLIGISGRINSGKDTVAKIIQDLTTQQYEWVTSTPWVPSPWIIKKFADTLKDMVCLLLGCTREQLEDREFKEKELGEEWKRTFNSENELIENRLFNPNIGDYQSNLTPRLLMQLLGTEAGRNILHPDIWVNAVMSKYKPFDKGNAHDLKNWSEVYTHKECTICKKSYSGYKRQYLCKECIEDDNIQLYPHWIITDVRFPNELNAISKRNGITIRVNRPLKYEFNSELHRHELFDKEDRSGFVHTFNADVYNTEQECRDRLLKYEHPSENSLDSATFDYVIENDGDLEDLSEKVNQILIKEGII